MCNNIWSSFNDYLRKKCEKKKKKTREKIKVFLRQTMILSFFHHNFFKNGHPNQQSLIWYLLSISLVGCDGARLIWSRPSMDFGNAMTSRIDFVPRMTLRYLSRPRANPACGGAPAIKCAVVHNPSKFQNNLTQKFTSYSTTKFLWKSNIKDWLGSGWLGLTTKTKCCKRKTNARIWV